MLGRWAALAETCMTFLREAVTFSMVTIPEALAVLQLEDVVQEFERYGLRVHRLVVNNVVKTTHSEFLRCKPEQQAPQLERLRELFPDLPIREVPLFPHELRGSEHLKQLADLLYPS